MLMKIIPKGRVAALLTAAVAAAVLAGTGIAYASIPDSGGTIHGCYSKSGSLSVIDTDAGQACAKGETALNWNQTGPQGPAGPAGPAGPSTAGAGGLDVIEVTGPPSGTSTSTGTTAVCPPDHPYVLGGGGAAIGSQPNWIGMAVSKPDTVNGATRPNAWTVQGVPDGAETFTAYALCAR
jgi:hypothetical protein